MEVLFKIKFSLSANAFLDIKIVKESDLVEFDIRLIANLILHQQQ